MYDSIVNFLKKVRPSGPWTIYAMSPDKHVRVTKSFDATEITALKDFLAKYIGFCNLYFLVNPARTLVEKNPEKDQIEQVEYFHVDIDPPKDGSVSVVDAKPKMLAKIHHYRMKPTLILDSGGGYQCLYKLKKPVKVIASGDADNVAEIEAYNRQLERDFEADHCHNINRLFRLPHTTNFPDEVKKKRGRVDTPTKIVSFNDNISYDLKSFIQAEIVSQNICKEAMCDVDIKWSDVLPVDLDSIASLANETRHLIEHGDTSDKRFAGDRSRAVMAATNQMVKAGIADEKIVSILLDRHYKISDHMYSRRNSRDYAVRQVVRAKQHCVHPMLADMNSRYVVAQEGGKTFVFSEEYSPELAHIYIKRQTFHAFQEYFQNKYVDEQQPDGTIKRYEAGKWWLRHPQRQSFPQVVFMPNKNIPDAYNLWKGFKYEPKQGSWKLFDKHIYEVVCNCNKNWYDYTINWMARAVQNPASPGHVAIVLRGARGGGKGTFGRYFGDLFGRHFLAVTQKSHVTGKFNAHLRDCILLHGDEAFFAADKQNESALKHLITEERMPIEGKGVDVVQKPNYIHLIMTSNEEWVVPAGDLERRFFVLDVNPDFLWKNTKDDNIRYFAAIEKELNNGGYEAMLYDLLTRDISTFNIWNFPHTPALTEQQILSLQPEDRWWLEKLLNGQIRDTQLDWSDRIIINDVLEDYQNAAGQQGARFKKINLDSFFRRVLPGNLLPKKIKTRGTVFNAYEGKAEERLITYYVFPSLDDCRAAFCKVKGIKIDWPKEENVLTKTTTDAEIPF